jgi:Tfp pilus assembly protein PilF/4-amino-4-deoxy-L-arabinose transferase-like glycosyltransferase
MSWFREDASEEQIKDLYLVIAVFVIAAVLRLVYFFEFNDVPFFDHPVGDSRIYHERALDIAAGDLVGREAYFHSSPLYPYLMALVYSVFGDSFTALRILQFLFGSVNCVLIYLLTRRVAPWAPAAPLAAGVAAALYGTLAFFDGDLLMIPLVLTFTCASLLLLTFLVDPEAKIDEGSATMPRGWKPPLLALASGVLLGMAGLGKPNVLLFAPFALIWIFTGFAGLAGFGRSFVARRWPAAILFTIGCVAAVTPITLRNYAVSNDFVLVSSNAGVNFYIGNNEKAEGIYMLPPESGLDNTRLYLSSREAAETATGRESLKPSEVSAFWTSQALDFFRERPGDALALLGHKFRLFWNHYEIPNHHNKYFLTIHYTPFLSVLFVGFKLVAPLAVMGIVLAVMTLAYSAVMRLYLGFVVVYMVSLVPFFITARYRLPVVPFLIIFAVVGAWKLVEALQKKRWRRGGIAAGVGIATAVFVSWPMMDYDFGFNHTVVGTVYSDLATEEPDDAADYIELAILEYKTALELRPLSVDAHYNLGIAYQRIGYYSGAVEELEAAVRLQPTHTYASKALAEAERVLAETGDRIDATAVPKTMFERGVDYTKRKQREQAGLMYSQVLKSDPHHPGAWSQMGTMRFDEGNYREAIRLFKKGLSYKPDHFVLNNNIAGAYYKRGDTKRARRHWEKCLEIDPDNESVRRQLNLLDQS